MWATSTAIVRNGPVKPSMFAHRAAASTATVESNSPANDNAQNGTISAATERSPVLCHTHRRLSSNDGTVPTAVATTLAHAGDAVRVATSTPSTVRLVTVAIPETAQ